MAKAKFEKIYSLRGSDFDRNLRIKPSSVLDLFQDVAGLHAEELGVGFNSMLQRNMLWVIIREKYAVVKAPHMYQTVKVTTWPKEPKRIDFVRNYQITDLDGNVLINGSSQWAVIDSTTRKLTRASNVYDNIESFCEDDVFPLSRAAFAQNTEKAYSVKTGYTDLDSNGHVNNIRYADYIVNALDEHNEIRSFQIDFHKEIMLGDEIDLFVDKNDGKLAISGKRQDEIMFSSEIEEI